MKNIIRNLIRNIVFAFGILYGINVFLSNTNIHFPINICSLLITTLLGAPGLISLFAIFYIIK